MKPSHLILAGLGALVLAPAVAAAQPSAPPRYSGGGYYSQPAQTLPGGFHDRMGRMSLGGSIGLGGLKVGNDSVTCPSCDYDPIAAEIDLHVGGFLSPQFALLFEVQANAQTIQENAFGATSLVQAAAMIAGQYWLSTQLWVKGGIGAASLSYSHDDGFGQTSEDIDEGLAAMGAVGYELLSARNFAIDLQARAIIGNYNHLDQRVSAGSIGVGLNWY